MKPSDKIKQKILTDLGIEIENVSRTYAGRNMKSSGAWVWEAKVKGSLMEIGSPHPITLLLKSKKIKTVRGWTFAQIEIEID